MPSRTFAEEQVHLNERSADVRFFCRALFRTRTGDPLLTIERRTGNGGHSREAAGTKIPQTEGIDYERLTARGRACSRWCSLSVPFGDIGWSELKGSRPNSDSLAFGGRLTITALPAARVGRADRGSVTSHARSAPRAGGGGHGAGRYRAGSGC